VALRRRVLEQRQMNGYHRTKFLLTTAPGLQALCWLCIPDGAIRHEPRPAMIATPGHGIGAKDLLAMDMKGKPRREGRGYQKDYALQTVRLGYAVLVVEPLGFGERCPKDMVHLRTSGDNGCYEAAWKAIMLGITLPGVRINDLRRCLDYMQTVPHVDRDRIGLMGISGGGQLTMWASAVEPRFKVAIVSGYMTSFRQGLMRMRRCLCQAAPGLVQQFEMSDIATLIAPRPILFESGTQDPFCPIKATREAIHRVRRNYRVLGVQDRVESDIFRGDHQWSGRKLRSFLSKWL
jgi:dienelactone hydrolase